MQQQIQTIHIWKQ